MAAKMKESGYRIPGQTDSVAESIVQESQQAVRKEKVKKSSTGATNEKSMLVPETNWSQEQQRALEAAIVKYRKTAGGDRWQKIANSVPEKTKEECLVRYKYLCELVKTQKKAEEEELEAETAESVNAQTAAQEDEESTTSAATLAENITEATTPPPSGKKLSKREQRRRKRDLSSDEDSDDAYQYEIS